MNVNVIGPQGGIVQPDLHANIVLAVRNFAQQLGISRLKNKILVRVHHKVFMNDDGTQALCESIDQRNFVIDVCMYSNWVVNLAHEMVHLYQMSVMKDPYSNHNENFYSFRSAFKSAGLKLYR